MSKTAKKKNVKKVKPKNDDEKYQKLELHEHILEKNGMYVGSCKKEKVPMWIFNEDRKSNDPFFINREITYTPGFYKIFDEILVNARDHVIRCQQEKSKEPCTMIKVWIDKKTGRITVWNNGEGISTNMHPKEKIFIPSLIFGELLTGTNFDNTKKRIIGGTNGLGSKLTNIFSIEFIVETLDSKNNKKFKQVFKNNMYDKGKPVITSGKGKRPYTRISFIPDFAKFGLKGLTSDIISLFKKRVYDIAMNSGVKVYYNDEHIKANSFAKYPDLYFSENAEHQKIIHDKDPNWKVCVIYNPTDKIEHQTISFVNGICTSNGGFHCEYITSQIVNKLKTAVAKKAKNVTIKPAMIKENLIFFIDSCIVNPEFNSQTKEYLTTKPANFGSTYTPPDSFMKAIIKTGVIDQIVANALAKAEANIGKGAQGKSSLLGIEKLYDAHRAKLKQGDCTLILTEGDSAATFALSGLNVVGRDYFGVFPLKGKLLNVREKTPTQISANEEIKSIISIMGLDPKKQYQDTKGLRYGNIMVLADQDSVTADTPLLLRTIGRGIEIKTIDNIVSDWTMKPNGKEYGTTYFQIWTENGWTNIKNVIRHKVKKSIYRVLTHTGVVDVTEDHSLLNMDADKITPKECIIGTELLHNYPKFEDAKVEIPGNFTDLTVRELWKYASQLKIHCYQSKGREKLIELIQEYVDSEYLKLNIYTGISAEEAYVMGFFWADGTCGIYHWKQHKKPINRPNEYIFNRTSYSWSITNANIEYLEKSKEILERFYDIKFQIIECTIKNPNHNRSFRLVAYGGEKSKLLIEKYRKLFYDKEKKKYIPSAILNSAYLVRENFFLGYYNGDGNGHELNNKGWKSFDINGKIGAHCMYYICKSLGYEVSINHNIKKPNIYTLTITKGHLQANPYAIKKIICLGKTEQYVYDLETENHHFQAGIGQMIVHNTDGSHIKGLVMNFIHYFWPSLIKQEGFIRSFVTPIVKATKGKGKNMQIEKFSTMQAFEEWKENNNGGKSWTFKYYKGLGTSKAAEAQECFEDLDDKLIYYYWQIKAEEEAKSKKENKKAKSESKELIEEESELTPYKPIFKDASEDAIKLGFSKGKIQGKNDIKWEDVRKTWLNTYDPKVYIDASEKRISYCDFIHKELIAFSVYSTSRAIPNIMDGLKPGQRKVLFACFKKNLYGKEIKVAQLAGYVSENAEYHHGEKSLEETIVKMAQNYMGSNNINLLYPSGQFGSRLAGGKDSASARYIYTYLIDLCKKIFNDDDIEILDQQCGDTLDSTGKPIRIEPTFYSPVVPMVLVNGGEGIGTGYSWKIEPCDPHAVIVNVKRVINGEKPKEMKPWYRHFNGKIEKIEKNKYLARALYNQIDKDTIHITDLPPGVWTHNYKAFLDGLLQEGITQKKETKKVARQQNIKGKSKGRGKGGSKKQNTYLAKKSKNSRTAKVAKTNTIGADIKSYKEDCTEIRVSFTITFHPGKLAKYMKNGTLETNLKLAVPLNNTNMYLFDANGKIKKYASYGGIIKDFVTTRLKLYKKRKEYLLDKWRKEMDMLKWKLKFIEAVIADEIAVFKKKTSQIIGQLEELKFPKFITGDKKNPSYDYLTSMTIIKFTKDEVEKLRKQIQEKKEEIEILEVKTSSQIWLTELDEFIDAYDKWEAEENEAYEDLMKKKKGVINKKKRAPNKEAEMLVD